MRVLDEQVDITGAGVPAAAAGTFPLAVADPLLFE
jgi:hypothetical protein